MSSFPFISFLGFAQIDLPLALRNVPRLLVTFEHDFEFRGSNDSELIFMRDM